MIGAPVYPTVHGGKPRNRKHGDTVNGQRTAEYRAWRHMKTRCYNQNSADYPEYGGRGITMCESWRNDFTVFLADMGRRPSSRHSIDRINGNGNYEPSNCRWATTIEQGRNRSITKWVTVNGERRTVKEWADILGLKYAALQKRIFMNTLRGMADLFHVRPSRPVIHCGTCGKEFKRMETTQRFCSHKCWQAHPDSRRPRVPR